MGTYIYSILCASLTAAVLSTLAPEKESMSKYIAFAGALAVALCIIQPFINGDELIQLPELFDSEEDRYGADDSYTSAEYTARNAIISFCALSGINTDKVVAEVGISDADTYVVLRYSADIPGNAEDMENKLSEILGVDVTVCCGGG